MFDHKSKTTPDWDKGESGASRNMEPALHKEMDKEGNINADVKDFDVKRHLESAYCLN
ncbi:hypothetical protein [Desulfospira joergensenii]|uniref:hypothetical protein n=1 Tax=Desulfospira joergensenii TaxID=53329 RepID=UPI0003B358E3|nr:hypothetical protein [Desulfospira joergensenii]